MKGGVSLYYAELNKCLVPADRLAQMALVFWTNGEPQILMSGYVKIGKSPVILESMAITCNPVESSSPRGTNVMQWNFSPGFGYTGAGWVSNQPPYRRLEVAPPRMFLHSGHQLVIPLADFGQTNEIASNGRTGVELRVLLQALQGPAVLTLPDQFDRTNYIAGFGYPGTMEETLDKIKKWPTDP